MYNTTYGIDVGTSYRECKAFIEAINHTVSLEFDDPIPLVFYLSELNHWIIQPLFTKDIERINRIYNEIIEE